MDEIRIPAMGGDGTTRIQAAIDRAAYGPVRIVLERGVHVSGGLRLRSDVELHFGDGAELHFIADYDAYALTEVEIEAEDSNRAMIVARNSSRIALTGSGRILGSGTAFSLGDNEELGVRIPARLRPRLLVLDTCTDVRIDGITVLGSPMWTLHLVNCAGVAISGVTVDNDRRMPNTDGIVIDGCRDVSITGCSISTADDGIVLKTTMRADGTLAAPCERVRVADCRLLSRSCALKIGTESFSPFRDIVFEDCAIAGSNRALGIFSRDGGTVENVRFSRISVDCEETPFGFWGSGEALTINVVDRRPDDRPAGGVSGIVVEGISGRMQGAVNLFAEHPGGIADVRLDGIDLEQNRGMFGTGLSYDLRPTPADLLPSPDANGRKNAWRKDAEGRIVGIYSYHAGMPGILAHNVTGLKMSDLRISRPDPLPDGFNPQLIVRTGAGA